MMRIITIAILLACGLASAATAGESRPVGRAIFDLNRAGFPGASSAKLLAADVSGDGVRDLVVADLSPRRAALWILEGGRTGFALGYRKAWARSRVVDLDAGDVNGDGADEIVLCLIHPTNGGAHLETRLHVIGRAPQPSRDRGAYCIAWASPPVSPCTVRCLRLGSDSVIAAGGMYEVRFFRCSGGTYAEVPEQRIGLKQLVPHGRQRPGGTRRPEDAVRFFAFGPGIGVVEALAMLETSPGRQRLAITARDVLSDHGSGAVVVLAWKDRWVVEDVIVTKRQPERLVVADLVANGRPQLIVTEWDNADVENVVLYARQGQRWVERWRLGPQREEHPRFQIADIAVADRRVLAVARNVYDSRDSFTSASVDLYSRKEGHSVRLARIPCDRRLLALVSGSQSGHVTHTLIVLQDNGIGRAIDLASFTGGHL